MQVPFNTDKTMAFVNPLQDGITLDQFCKEQGLHLTALSAFNNGQMRQKTLDVEFGGSYLERILSLQKSIDRRHSICFTTSQIGHLEENLETLTSGRQSSELVKKYFDPAKILAKKEL